MIETRQFFATESVTVKDYRCPGHDTPCGREEHAEAFQVVLPRRGMFRRHREGMSTLVGPGHALLDNLGQSYSVSHPMGGGDIGTCLSFTEPAVRDVLTNLGIAHDDSASLLPVSYAPTTPKLVLLCQALRQRMRLGHATTLEVEETGLRILAQLLMAAPGRRAGVMQAQAGARRRRKELVESAKLTIAKHLERAHSLNGLARDLGCSPFHLARTFRAETGLPLHRYLLWLRISVGLDRIADGETNLSALAFELGFSSHSHFTAAFGRTLGVTPSGFRHQLQSLKM